MADDIDLWAMGNDGLLASLAAGYRLAAATGANAGDAFPASLLVFRDANGQYVVGADGSAASPALTFSGDADTGLYRIAANTLGFAAGGAGIARLDTLGLRVGTIGANLAGERVTIFSNGDGSPSFLSRYDAGANKPYCMIRHIDATSQSRLDANGGAGVAALSLAIKNVDALVVNNDLSATFSSYVGVNNGTAANPIIRFNNDLGTGFYRFGASTLGISLGGVVAGVWGSSALRAGADNNMALGHSSYRWSVVYAGTGTINTSDAREKTWRGAASPTELAAARRIVGELGFYQWNDAIAEKGAAGARLHFGVRAQAVWAIMADEGLIDPIVEGVRPDSRYAFLCYDAWDAIEEVEEVRDADDNIIVAAQPAQPAGDRFGVRPDQLALFLIAAQEARLAALEASA